MSNDVTASVRKLRGVTEDSRIDNGTSLENLLAASML